MKNTKTLKRLFLRLNNILLIGIVLCVLVLPVINIPTPVYAIGGQQQVIIGGLSDPLSKTATEYNCLSGGENWETLLEDGQIFSAPGALSSFKVSLTQPAGTWCDLQWNGWRVVAY